MPVELREPEVRFVGRDAELRALEAALARAAAGRGSLVALTGEAGIGKTRLVEELIHRAALPAGRVLWGRCLEQAGAPSYWPWMRVLRGYASDSELDALRATLGADGRLLAPLVPGLTPPGDHAARAVTAAGDAEGRYHLFDAVARLLRYAASEPLLIVLEDVHWADEASLALLDFIAHELDGTRLLIVVTVRDRERPRIPRPLTDVVRRSQRIALQGLDRDAVAAIVASATGIDAPPAAVDRLADVTAGNPFFLGEVLRTLAQEGRLAEVQSPHAPLTVPDTVRDSIRQQLEPLAPDERDVLALAAVAGQEFEIPVVQTAMNIEATTVLERLGAAVERGLVREGLAGRFRFAHALVRETIYGDILPAARVHLHARIGEALERLHGDAAPLGELANHFLHAAPLGTTGKVVEYATRAARQAMALYAYHDALVSYEHALAALGPNPTDRARRHALRLAAAEAARRAGINGRGRELYREAAQDARALGLGPGLVNAAVGYYLLSPNTHEHDPYTVPLLEEALRIVGDRDSSPRAMLLATLGAARAGREGGPAADACSREAVAIATRLGDPAALAIALVGRQLVIVGPNSTAERLALADQALAMSETAAGGLEHFARAARAHCLLEVGDLAGANAEVDWMAAEAERRREPTRLWQVAVRRASIALHAGRFDDGVRLATEALAVRRNASDSQALHVFVQQMFLARRDTGRHGGLEGSLRWMVEHHPETQIWRCMLAVLLADRGRQTEARSLFDTLAAEGFAHLQPQNYAALVALLARVCHSLGDTGNAAELYRRLHPYAEINIVLGPDSQGCLGPAHRYLALLAATQGQFDTAEEHFRAAIAMGERMGALPSMSACHHEHARALERRDAPGDQARARDLRERAEAVGWSYRTQLRESTDTLPPAARAAAHAASQSPVAPVAGHTPLPDTRVAVLRRDGDVWQVGLGGETVRIKNAKGIQLLAVLLKQPGQEIHVLDLAAGPPGDASTGELIDRGDAGPLLDPAARAAYKARLEDLRDELEEAERFNDPQRAARARQEIDFLADELARGVGLGGRDRRAASAAERARVNVTRTINGAVKKIAALSPRLGEHLRATVHTGYLCSYAPDATSPIRWEL